MILQTAVVNECIKVYSVQSGTTVASFFWLLLPLLPFCIYILIYFEKSHAHTLHICARTHTHTHTPTHTHGKETDEQMSKKLHVYHTKWDIYSNTASHMKVSLLTNVMREKRLCNLMIVNVYNYYIHTFCVPLQNKTRLKPWTHFEMVPV